MSEPLVPSTFVYDLFDNLHVDSDDRVVLNWSDSLGVAGRWPLAGQPNHFFVRVFVQRNESLGTLEVVALTDPRVLTHQYNCPVLWKITVLKHDGKFCFQFLAGTNSGSAQFLDGANLEAARALVALLNAWALVAKKFKITELPRF